MAGLILTALATRYTQVEVNSETKRDFEFACQDIQIKIADRLRALEQILRGCAAFVEQSGRVSRQEWRNFTARQKVDVELPGVQGIGFALLIPPEQLARHVQEIRAEGFPTYELRPPGEREVYSSVIYVEPFTNRNLRAFGYDMLSEPVRRAALIRARDTDSAALSGKVVLVQETDQDVQAGTLLFVPVYRPGAPRETTAQRRNALLGWVYSPHRMNDLMRGILGNWDQAGPNRVRLQVFDGEKVSSENLLYDSLAGARGPRRGAAPSVLQTGIVSAGRQWTLRFTLMGQPSGAKGDSKAWLVLVGGASTSLLLAGLFLSALNTWFKARQMALELTANLVQSEHRYRSLLNAMPDGYSRCRMVFDRNGRPTDFVHLEVDRAFEQLTGLREAVGKTVTALIPGIAEENAALFDRYGRVVSTEQSERFEVFLKPLARWYSISATFAGGGCFATIFQDISEIKRIEREFREKSEHYELLLQTSTDAIHIVDREGNLLEWNEAFRAHLQYEPGEMGRLKVADWDARWSEAELKERIASLIRSGSRFETEHRRKDGSIRQVEINGAGMRWKGQEVLYASARDMTERKAAEADLQELHVQAQREAQVKAELLKEINHRVKNNLASILGLLVNERRQTPAEGRAFVEVVLERLTQRISSLLEVHQMLADSQWAPIRLTELAERILRGVCRALPEGHRVLPAIAPSELRVSPRQAANAALVLNELVTNSIKHASEARPLTSVRFQVEAEGENLRLEYRDNGVGYPAAVLCGEQAGLGLKLIRQLATESLRGSLEITNSQGAVTVLLIKAERATQT